MEYISEKWNGNKVKYVIDEEQKLCYKLKFGLTIKDKKSIIFYIIQVIKKPPKNYYVRFPT